MKHVSMKKIVMAILFSLLVIQSAGASDSQTAAKVVAKVGDLEITDQDVAARLAQIPPQYKNAYASEEGKKQFVEQLVQEQLVYLRAQKDKYDTNAQVVKQLEQAKRNIMIRQFFSDTFSKIKVSEEELAAYYKDNKAQFMEAPKVWAKHILCKTEEEAKAARDRVIKGESFEDVAKDVSTGPSGAKGGDLGWFARGQMVPEFGNKAFSLEKDAVSEPVKTQFGYHIIKVYDKKDAQTKSFEDARAELEKNLTDKKRKQFMDEMIVELKKEYPVTIF